MEALERADHIVMAANVTRKRQGVTVPQLAQMTGLSRTCLEKWFSGASKPGLYQMSQILDALGYELAVKRKAD